MLLVRGGDTSGPAPTFYVKDGAGEVGRVDDMAVIPGVGRLGRETTFRSFREVKGMRLPERIEVQLANPMIGPVKLELSSVTAGAATPEGWFRLEGELPRDR